MKTSSLLTLLPAATATVIRQRQTSEGCCFQLESVGVVNNTVAENNVGQLILAGSFQQGLFCLDAETNTIQDSRGNNCFMRAPSYQFTCYQGAVGPSVFEAAPSADGKTKLVYDGGPGTYFACPAAEESYEIYSTEKPDTDGCMEVALVLADETEECATVVGSEVNLRATQSVIWSKETSSPTTTLTMVVEDGYDYARATPDTAPPAASRTCSVASSAPSIAPQKIGFPDDSAPDGVHSTSDSASITSLNSTTFQYSIPRSFVTAENQLCALQFRLPICTALPEGYPCYSFSGLEQETLANSGMVFSLTDDDGKMAWNNSALHQVFPGQNTVLGTFECGSAARSSADDRKISWLASSVREFFLQYVQAGVGPDAEFEDGVGAWIVHCS